MSRAAKTASIYDLLFYFWLAVLIGKDLPKSNYF